jgi:hypothetical protein
MMQIRQLMVLALVATAACSDRYEAYFATHADAKSAGALGPGKWLPSFLPTSATEIREEHDIDTSESWVTFNVAEEFQVPTSCSPSVLETAFDDRAPHWWRQATTAMESPIQVYQCTDATELSGYWAHSECLLWTSLRKAAYRCSPGVLEPKPGSAQQAPAGG